MATLNTLRTRFGVILSAVIAFALLAFIFSLRSEMGFSGGEPVVAKINGHSVTMSEYQREYNKIQQLSGADESDEQQSQMLYSQTWQSLFTEFALVPELKQIGLGVSTEERTAILNGQIPTQVMYGMFGNPSTGAFDVNALNNFLYSAQGNPEAEQMWAMVTGQAVSERTANKYAALVGMGWHANALEIAEGLEAANKSFSGRLVVRPYSSIADSLVKISKSDIRGYYESHKEAYKRLPTRTISYAEFNVSPSSDDLAKLESDANSIAEEFAATEDIRTFVRSNRNGSISNTFLSAAQMSPAEAEKLVEGEMYGPVSDGVNWRMARVNRTITAADTLSMRHIVLPYTEEKLADSLLVALRDGGDFAAAVAQYSTYAESAQNGGELGSIPFAGFSNEYAEKLADAKEGDIVKIASGEMIQLFQVYKAGKRTEHYEVASINIPILPSELTRTEAHNAAGVFAVAAKDGVEAFKAAAGEAKVSALTADLSSASRTVAAIAGSREVASWAHKAEVGDLSEIFKVDGGYVVAMLSDINESEYMELSDVESTIEGILIADKKYEMMASELGGSTFDAKAASFGGKAVEFDGVSMASTYIQNVGLEPRVVGAIATSDAGVVSVPIKGNGGLYIFEVAEVTEAEEPQAEADIKLRSEMMMQNMTQQMLYSALESMSDVEDLRGQSL